MDLGRCEPLSEQCTSVTSLLGAELEVTAHRWKHDCRCAAGLGLQPELAKPFARHTEGGGETADVDRRVTRQRHEKNVALRAVLVVTTEPPDQRTADANLDDTVALDDASPPREPAEVGRW